MCCVDDEINICDDYTNAVKKLYLTISAKVDNFVIHYTIMIINCHAFVKIDFSYCN